MTRNPTLEETTTSQHMGVRQEGSNSKQTKLLCDKNVEKKVFSVASVCADQVM
jgi:hypothetical protein